MIDIAAFILSLRDVSNGARHMRLSPTSEHRSVAQQFDRLGAPRDTKRNYVDASANVSRSEYRPPIWTMVPQLIYGKCYDDIALRRFQALLASQYRATRRLCILVEPFIECYTHRRCSRAKSIFSNKIGLWENFLPKLSGPSIGIISPPNIPSSPKS